jgi:hypothetical protein
MGVFHQAVHYGQIDQQTNNTYDSELEKLPAFFLFPGVILKSPVFIQQKIIDHRRDKRNSGGVIQRDAKSQNEPVQQAKINYRAGCPDRAEFNKPAGYTPWDYGFIRGMLNQFNIPFWKTL